MSKRLIAYLILFSLLLGGGYWLYNWNQRGFILFGDPAWPTLRSASLNSLSIHNESGEYTLLAKDGEWFVADALLRPQYKADNTKVEELLTAIRKMPPLAHVSRYSKDQGARFGLNNGSVGITIAGKSAWTLSFGDKGPQENTVYVRSSLQGDQIVLCDGRLERFIKKQKAAYYDMRLITFSPESIVRVEAKGPESGMWTIGREKKKTVFSAPEILVQYPVDTKRFEMLVQALADVRGTGFVSTEVDPKTLVSYSVWQAENKVPQQLSLYRTADGAGSYVVRSSRHGKQVALDPAGMEKLIVTAFQLRQRPVFSADLSDVTRQRILVRNKNATCEYVANRRNDGWFEQSSSTTLTGVDMIMWRLRELQYLAAPREQQPKSAELSVTWQFFEKEQETSLATLFFYTDTNLPSGQCWLKVLGEDLFYPVDKQLLDDIKSRLPAPNWCE